MRVWTPSLVSFRKLLPSEKPRLDSQNVKQKKKPLAVGYSALTGSVGNGQSLSR